MSENTEIERLRAAALTGPFTTTIVAPGRAESTTPCAYRLAKIPDGELVLQGSYVWHEGWNNSGHEWRDIPTVELAATISTTPDTD